MADAIKHKTFYAAIAGCIVGLFAMMVIPCFIAMCVSRYREKRQLHRDALAREAAEDDSTDYLVYGPFPYDSSLYHVDEVGESSGYRAPNNSVESLDSAIQLDATLEDDAAIAMALAEQEDDIAITTTEQNLDNLREPQYEGKGKALMYSHIQEVLVDQQEQQLSESVQAQLPGPIQEGLSERLPAALAEAAAELPAELPAEQKAAEESQDAPEGVPKATPAENEQ
ncbi:hypothetical protein TRIATDRAFT_84290 [Trichoderma atroviride IMI 206040]|uniref:Uncharacterized protein n=2 Tax=Hypocrea atroviridis TaxID=63577 RepID=G9P4A3_HYPAI|nr:uncharacterized protein TRIATDRAFT_84290 [Trichoderma atroviride IMI 206040]EHK41946.1 hypothetical protein TRIATDRAFT_84290 [Trichoderma atroviride IMI 206040]